jgi:tetratricopeptide (TPR) repeat protein
MKSTPLHALLVVLSIFALSQVSYAQKSQKIVDSLQKDLAANPPDTLKVKLLNEIGYEYIMDDSAQATDYALKGLALAKKVGYLQGEMNAENVLGLTYYYSSNYDEALKHHELAHKIALQLNDNAKLAVTLNNIGLIYDDKADYGKALKYYLESLALVEDNENSAKGKWQMGGTLNNIACFDLSGSREIQRSASVSQPLASRKKRSR